MRDVLYVSELKKNLVSVSTIEDRGFGVYVLDGKVRVFPKAVGPSASYAIGVRCGNSTSFSSNHIMHCHTLRAAMSYVSYGTGGWPIFIIQL